MLANVMRKPMEQVFAEFAGRKPSVDGDTYTGSGDVKYHLGTSYDRPTLSGGYCRLGCCGWVQGDVKYHPGVLQDWRSSGGNRSTPAVAHLHVGAGCAAHPRAGDASPAPTPAARAPLPHPSGACRQAHPPVPAGQPLAPGGGQHRVPGQGKRSAARRSAQHAARITAQRSAHHVAPHHITAPPPPSRQPAPPAPSYRRCARSSTIAATRSAAARCPS